MIPVKRRFVLRVLVVVNLLILAMIVGGRIWRATRVPYGTSIIVAQWILLSFWVVLGTSGRRIRVAGGVLGCACLASGAWSGTLSQLRRAGVPAHSIIAMLLMDDVTVDVLAAAGAMAIMGLAGLRIVCCTTGRASRGAIWPQFSLRGLFGFTGAVAIAVCFGTFARSIPIGSSLFVWCFVRAAGSALITCVIVRAALSPAPSASRVTLANMLAALVTLVEAYYLQYPAAALPGVFRGAFVEAIWLSISLLVVRACGYRAIWPADWIWAAGLADEIEA